MSKGKLIEILYIYIAFVKIGAFTFGGGLAMMPMMQRELVDKRNWITEEDLIDYYAIGQSTPGIIAVNVSTFVGYKRMGIIGGIIGTLGVISPSLLIIMILANLIDSVDEFPVVQRALRGVNVAVAALLTFVIYKFAKKTIKNIWHVLYMLVSFSLIYFLKVQSYWIIIGSLVIGCIIAFVNQKKLKKSDKEDKE